MLGFNRGDKSFTIFDVVMNGYLSNSKCRAMALFNFIDFILIFRYFYIVLYKN